MCPERSEGQSPVIARPIAGWITTSPTFWVRGIWYLYNTCDYQVVNNIRPSARALILGYFSPKDHTSFVKRVADNRRARYDYEILDTVEAGVVLTGPEAKSCRLGHVHLAGAYVSFLSGKPVLKNASIAPYAYASGVENYDPGHDRPLLLKTSEIRKLTSGAEEKGMTVVPLEVRAGKFIKVLLGLGRGKKKFDKRRKIKE